MGFCGKNCGKFSGLIPLLILLFIVSPSSFNIHQVGLQNSPTEINSPKNSFKSLKNSRNSLDFTISANIGDILSYNSSFGEETNFFQYNLTALSNNSTHLFLSYDYFNTTEPSQLWLNHSKQWTNHSQALLSGDLALDFFSNLTLVSIILPEQTNFSSQYSEFDVLLQEFNENDDYRAEITVNPNGLSLRIDFYYRIIIFLHVMSLEAYYSTDRILLLYRVWMRNPTGNQQGNLNFQIMPEYSTVNSAVQNPFDPFTAISGDNNSSGSSNSTNSTDSTNSADFPDSGGFFPTPSRNLIIDWKAGLIIGGGIAGLAAVIGGTVFGVRYLKKKKAG